MNKTFFATGAILGGLSVVLGAFAAHALKSILPLDAVAIFETGVRYQFYHALALLILAVSFEKLDAKWGNRTGLFFILGIALFSGSLYTLSFLKMGEPSAIIKLVGIITPFGGLAFIIGWLFLVLAVLKKLN